MMAAWIGGAKVIDPPRPESPVGVGDGVAAKAEIRVFILSIVGLPCAEEDGKHVFGVIA